MHLGFVDILISIESHVTPELPNQNMSLGKIVTPVISTRIVFIFSSNVAIICKIGTLSMMC